VILALLIVAGGIAVVLALGWSLVVVGLRAGDQAGDASVTAAADAGQLAIVVVVRNPGDVPLVTGLSVRRRFRAGAHETVGVVPATSQAEFRLPVTAPARRYRLTAVVGQRGAACG
jgi:hypothetical protein